MSNSMQKHGIHSWKDLLVIAESALPPDTQPGDSPYWCADVSFDAKEGWKVVIFYDCGDIDYINTFVTPDGETIDFWEWPPDHPWVRFLINWRGKGDLERLLAIDALEQQPHKKITPDPEAEGSTRDGKQC